MLASSVRFERAPRRRYAAGDVFAYKIQKVFGLPLFGKICCLFLFTVPMVALGGMLYKAVGPDEDGEEGAGGGRCIHKGS